MKKYLDVDRGKIYTRDELYKEFEILRLNRETDAETFGQYLNNCLSKNGSLEEINN